MASLKRFTNYLADLTPKQQLVWVLLCIFVIAPATLFIIGSGLAHASYNASNPSTTYGNVVCATTATKIPTASMAPRGTVSIENLGPNDIYVGFDANVTTSNGTKVSASGGSISLDLNYDGVRGQVYCITTVLQVSPADSRYIEIH